MRKIGLVLALCATLILCMSGPATAKLFNVEIDGERIVVDYYVPDEQAWLDTEPGEPGYWEGLEWGPDRDYGFKIWYPYLEDTFDMTLPQQLAWIRDLDYAGITDWRIAYFWDMNFMKASMFGGMELGLPMPNIATDCYTDLYFPPTACGPNPFPVPGDFLCMYLGRTGNEDGLTNGAIINPMWGFPGPIPPSYLADGLLAKTGMMGVPNYYTLPRSFAQDHWVNFPADQNIQFDTNTCMFNDDLNGNPDDTTVGVMSPVDDVTGQPIGAWSVATKWPVLSPGNPHVIEISAVDEYGYIVPVDILCVRKNRHAKDPLFAGDGIVELSGETKKGKRGVYDIHFLYLGDKYTFKVTIPKVKKVK